MATISIDASESESVIEAEDFYPDGRIRISTKAN